MEKSLKDADIPKKRTDKFGLFFFKVTSAKTINNKGMESTLVHTDDKNIITGLNIQNANTVLLNLLKKNLENKIPAKTSVKIIGSLVKKSILYRFM
jgi:hypothetical protein